MTLEMAKPTANDRVNIAVNLYRLLMSPMDDSVHKSILAKQKVVRHFVLYYYFLFAFFTPSQRLHGKNEVSLPEI